MGLSLTVPHHGRSSSLSIRLRYDIFGPITFGLDAYIVNADSQSSPSIVRCGTES